MCLGCCTTSGSPSNARGSGWHALTLKGITVDEMAGDKAAFRTLRNFRAGIEATKIGSPRSE
jgi:hypothetical protein